MAQIQIIDLNPSDFGFMEELTDEELLGINGGRNEGVDPKAVAAWLRATADLIDPPCKC